MDIGEPHLFGSEREVFEASLAKSHRYCEFGLGGSSLLAVRKGVDTIVAVDSDRQWVEAVRKHPEIVTKVLDGSMSVLHGDIGPVREWGNPADQEHMQKWPNYIGAAWAEWGRRQVLPDLVFVDGRFRIACCLSVIVAFGIKLSERPLIMLHDFNDERPHYKQVFQFFDLDMLKGSLAFLRIRDDVSIPAVLARLLQQQFDYG
jgi:hypothetical protein